MEQLLTLSWIIVAAFIALVILAVILSTVTRRRMLRLGDLPAEQLHDLQVLLVDSVKAASMEPGMRIRLGRLWKSLVLSPAQQFVVSEPLIKDGTLHEAKPADNVEAAIYFVRRSIMNRPATSVVLNSRDWQKMTSGVGASVVIGTMYGGVLQQGNHNEARNCQGDIDASTNNDSDYIQRIVDALRIDGSHLGHDEAGEKAMSLADSLESDLRAQRWGSIRGNLEVVASLVASGTTVFVNVSKVLAS